MNQLGSSFSKNRIREASCVRKLKKCTKTFISIRWEEKYSLRNNYWRRDKQVERVLHKGVKLLEKQKVIDGKIAFNLYKVTDFRGN